MADGGVRRVDVTPGFSQLCLVGQRRTGQGAQRPILPSQAFWVNMVTRRAVRQLRRMLSRKLRLASASAVQHVALKITGHGVGALRPADVHRPDFQAAAGVSGDGHVRPEVAQRVQQSKSTLAVVSNQQAGRLLSSRLVTAR
jgi:hypothetical protein